MILPFLNFFNYFLLIVINFYICVFTDKHRAETKKEGYSIQVLYTVCVLENRADAPSPPFTQSLSNWHTKTVSSTVIPVHTNAFILTKIFMFYAYFWYITDQTTDIKASLTHLYSLYLFVLLQSNYLWHKTKSFMLFLKALFTDTYKLHYSSSYSVT